MYIQGKCIRHKYKLDCIAAQQTARWLDVHFPWVFIISPLLGRVVVRPQIDLDKCRTGLRDEMI
jgi:hypothetical protein